MSVASAIGSPTVFADVLGEQPLELVVDRLVDDEALGCDAGLAVVQAARDRGDLSRPGQVGGRHDHERVTTPSSSTTFLISLPAMAATDDPAGPDPVSVAAVTTDGASCVACVIVLSPGSRTARRCRSGCWRFS